MKKRMMKMAKDRKVEMSKAPIKKMQGSSVLVLMPLKSSMSSGPLGNLKTSKMSQVFKRISTRYLVGN